MKCPACQALVTRCVEWTWTPRKILFLLLTSFWDANQHSSWISCLTLSALTEGICQLHHLSQITVSYTHDVTWNSRCVLSLMWAHITENGNRRWGSSNTMLGSPCILFTVSSGLISSPTAVSPHIYVQKDQVLCPAQEDWLHVDFLTQHRSVSSWLSLSSLSWCFTSSSVKKEQQFFLHSPFCSD